MHLCVLCGMFANFRFLKRTAHIITLKSSFSYEVLIVADVSSVRVCVCVCVYSSLGKLKLWQYSVCPTHQPCQVFEIVLVWYT